jgi:hypothetical protein
VQRVVEHEVVRHRIGVNREIAALLMTQRPHLERDDLQPRRQPVDLRGDGADVVAPQFGCEPGQQFGRLVVGETQLAEADLADPAVGAQPVELQVGRVTRRENHVQPIG